MPIGFRNIESGLFKCYSSAGSGTLGEPPEGYEEVLLQGPLAPDQKEPPPLTLAQRLDAVFMSFPVELRAQYYSKKAEIKVAIESGDYEVIHYIVGLIEVPDELEDEKAAIAEVLAEFGEE